MTSDMVTGQAVTVLGGVCKTQCRRGRMILITLPNGFRSARRPDRSPNVGKSTRQTSWWARDRWPYHLPCPDHPQPGCGRFPPPTAAQLVLLDTLASTNLTLIERALSKVPAGAIAEVDLSACCLWNRQVSSGGRGGLAFI